jgi:hypothetical protein
MDDIKSYEDSDLPEWPQHPAEDANDAEISEYIQAAKLFYVERVPLLRQILESRFRMLEVTEISLGTDSSIFWNFKTFLFPLIDGKLYINLVDGTFRMPTYVEQGSRLSSNSGVMLEANLMMGTYHNMIPNDKHLISLLEEMGTEIFLPENYLIDLMGKLRGKDIKNPEGYHHRIIQQERQKVREVVKLLKEEAIVENLRTSGYIS